MTKQVVLLNDAQASSSLALTQALGQAGISLLCDRLSESAESEPAGEVKAVQRNEEEVPLPLAVLYEVAAGAGVLEVHAAIERATLVWPGAPLVPIRHDHGQASHNGHHTRDGATHK